MCKRPEPCGLNEKEVIDVEEIQDERPVTADCIRSPFKMSEFVTDDKAVIADRLPPPSNMLRSAIDFADDQARIMV